MAFIDDNFLLHTPEARRLYHDHAAGQPIIDYHTHLPVSDLARDRRFDTLFDTWLAGDHYKWRAMRANGVSERYCTGDANPYEKFLAWAGTVPFCLRNPLYHWTHLELARYFDIHEQLDTRSAPRIWERANDCLRADEFSARGLLGRFNVEIVCTTDDPVDDLADHAKIQSAPFGIGVFPTFRPDRALEIHEADGFNSWLERLAAAADVHITRLTDFLEALGRRHQRFHDLGGRLSDHGLTQCPLSYGTDARASSIFDKARAGRSVSVEERSEFTGFMMLFFGHLDSAKGWTKQLHLGPIRNASTRLLRTVGRDAGADSIGSLPQAEALGIYLDRLDRDGALPRMVVYNVNPADNYALATLAGNFQDGPVPSRIQFGSGWWFLDQRDGIEMQLNTLSNTGLLSRFVGTLSDSRSFMSCPRHEYFRRILCNLIGQDMAHGDLPEDWALIGGLVEDVCYRNAARFFNWTGVGATPLTAGAH